MDKTLFYFVNYIHFTEIKTKSEKMFTLQDFRKFEALNHVLCNSNLFVAHAYGELKVIAVSQDFDNLNLVTCFNFAEYRTLVS